METMLAVHVPLELFVGPPTDTHYPYWWPQVIVDKNTRNKKKAITTVYGLDGFGIKLSEAAKLFGKKFASGAAVVKSPSEKDQIDIQGDCLERVRLLLLLLGQQSRHITPTVKAREPLFSPQTIKFVRAHTLACVD